MDSCQALLKKVETRRREFRSQEQASDQALAKLEKELPGLKEDPKLQADIGELGIFALRQGKIRSPTAYSQRLKSLSASKAGLPEWEAELDRENGGFLEADQSVDSPTVKAKLKEKGLEDLGDFKLGTYVAHSIRSVSWSLAKSRMEELGQALNRHCDEVASGLTASSRPRKRPPREIDPAQEEGEPAAGTGA